jgi:hypothetical protein
MKIHFINNRLTGTSGSTLNRHEATCYQYRVVKSRIDEKTKKQDERGKADKRLATEAGIADKQASGQADKQAR